jgi:ribosomal protein L20A (L18A)
LGGINKFIADEKVSFELSSEHKVTIKNIFFESINEETLLAMKDGVLTQYSNYSALT